MLTQHLIFTIYFKVTGCHAVGGGGGQYTCKSAWTLLLNTYPIFVALFFITCLNCQRQQETPLLSFPRQIPRFLALLKLLSNKKKTKKTSLIQCFSTYVQKLKQFSHLRETIHKRLLYTVFDICLLSIFNVVHMVNIIFFF